MGVTRGYNSVSDSNLTVYFDAGNSTCFTEGESTAQNLIGGGTLTLTNATGIPSGSGYWNFDGSGDYCSYPNDASNQPTTSVTLAAWCYFYSEASAMGIITKRSSSNFGLGIYLTDFYMNVSTGVWGGLQMNADSAYTLAPINQWHHIVGVYDGSTCKVYINGSEVGSASKTGVMAITDHPVRIGDLEGAGGFDFNGRIALPMIYKNKALTATEIKDQYNNFKGRFGI